MYTLVEDGIIQEIESGNNFGYILADNGYFVNTEYKVLHSQKSDIFIQCMKIIYNGKLELFYLTENYRPLSVIIEKNKTDNLITIISNLISDIIEVENNGFLSIQNINLEWNKIFVDTNTLKVKLIYLPVNIKTSNSYGTCENTFRSNLLEFINEKHGESDSRIEQLLTYLSNTALSLEQICNRLRDIGIYKEPKQSTNVKGENKITDESIRMVAMNAPGYFEIVINREEFIIGQKEGLVHAVIPFNKKISRKHCTITKQNEKYYVTDENSVNGTYVNGIRILPNLICQIKSGDILRLADSDFQIV